MGSWMFVVDYAFPVWCGQWVLHGYGPIGSGEAATRAGAKEGSAQPAVEWLKAYGYNP